MIKLGYRSAHPQEFMVEEQETEYEQPKYTYQRRQEYIGSV